MYYYRNRTPKHWTTQIEFIGFRISSGIMLKAIRLACSALYYFRKRERDWDASHGSNKRKWCVSVKRIRDHWMLDRPLYIPSAKYCRLVEWFRLNRVTRCPRCVSRRRRTVDNIRSRHNWEKRGSVPVTPDTS